MSLLAFRLEPSSTSETDESHLARDNDCMGDAQGASNQWLPGGFALPLPNMVFHCPPET